VKTLLTVKKAKGRKEIFAANVDDCPDFARPDSSFDFAQGSLGGCLYASRGLPSP
jgi:hypothetical protein